MTSAFPALVPPSDLVVHVPRALGMISLSPSLPLYWVLHIITVSSTVFTSFIEIFQSKTVWDIIVVSVFTSLSRFGVNLETFFPVTVTTPWV